MTNKLKITHTYTIKKKTKTTHHLHSIYVLLKFCSVLPIIVDYVYNYNSIATSNNLDIQRKPINYIGLQSLKKKNQVQVHTKPYKTFLLCIVQET